jgi:Mrp family chromosome partitioning ATPase
MIAGDLRSPATHEYFGTTPRTGLGEILSADDIADGGQLRGLIAVSARPIRTNLFLLASTSKRSDAVELLSSDALDSFFEELSYLGYEYVLIDAPPLLGIPDTRLLARHADSLLFVGRPDRLTPDLALDAREALDTLDTPVLGLVVVGARGDHTSYYSQPEAPVDMRPAPL